MASIKPYETKAGTRWRVRYRTPDRRQTDKRGFKTKRDAQQWLTQTQSEMNAGTWRPPTKTTLNSYAQQWLDNKLNISTNTHKTYEGSLKHIRNHPIGETYLTNLTREAIQNWITTLSNDLSPKSVRNSYNVLTAIMEQAVIDGYIANSPTAGVMLPRLEKVERRILTVQQVEAMATEAGNYGDHIRFLAYTGLRWAEFAGLQVKDVNLERGRFHVQRQLNKDNKTYSAPKHNKPRVVPLIEPAARIVVAKAVGKSSDAPIFTTVTGSLLNYHNARRDWFDPAAKKVGMQGLTPHELRHTFASVAISSGASIKALQTALGHHSASFTLDIYGHLFPDDYDAFSASMSRTFTLDCGQNVGKSKIQQD